MFEPSKNGLHTAALAALLALPLLAQAGNERVSASCSVSIDYTFNGTVVEAYRKDFVADAGAGFVDDFSTAIRSKRFTASVARESGNTVVAIDYFNDVGTFHNIGLNTRLTLHGGGIETNAGSHQFSTSLGVVGNHATNYTLACRRR
jgi:hypothetical protein